MSDRISELPDDIILSNILSSLTLRDAVKARLLSLRWRYLSAPISTLQFDLFNMFGIEFVKKDDYLDKLQHKNIVREYKSRFLTAVDQFLQLYIAPKITSFKVHFCLGNESASHIDKWVAFAIRMEAKEIDLYFSEYQKSCEPYSFPFHLLHSESDHLKHLRLGACTLRPSPELASRLNSLAILDLSDVILENNNDLESVLSGCLNLECLKLRNCRLPLTLCIHGHQFRRLKTLILHQIPYPHGPWFFELNSIDLETLDYRGFSMSYTFVSCSCLAKVIICISGDAWGVLDLVFNNLPSNLPQLQNLTLLLWSEHPLPIPEIMPRFTSLKQLELSILVSSDVDLLTITFILNAARLLEKIHLKLKNKSSNGPRQTREHSNHLHLHLKDVEISGFGEKSNEMELAIYFLKNAVELERMIVAIGDDDTMREKVHYLLLQEKVNSRVELIVL